MPKERILVVDDEEDILELVRYHGKSDEVVKLVLSRPPIFKDVVNAILTDDPGVMVK